MLHCSGIRNPAALAGKWQNRMVTANGDGITIVSFPYLAEPEDNSFRKQS